MIDKTAEAEAERRKAAEAAQEARQPAAGERQPLLPPADAAEAGPSSAPFPTAGGSAPDTPAHARPRTVRHHRRTLSGRSANSGYFGPSYHPSIYPAVNDPFTRQAKRAADARARSRFIGALALGVGLWLLIGVVLGWTGFQEFSGRGRLDYGAQPPVPPSEGTPFVCAHFKPTDTPFSAPLPRGYSASVATFAIPVSSPDVFFVHGQGSFAKGRVAIEVADVDADTVDVAVEARYNDAKLVGLMRVCEVRGRRDDGNGTGRDIGLGIYTPKPQVGPFPDSDLEFAVRLRVPRSLARLYTLEVRGEMFVIHAGDLTALDLERVDFESTNSKITFTNVRAHAIRARTSNGAIAGTFNVSSSLSLASNNGAIKAQVALFPRSQADDDLPALPPNPPADGTLAGAPEVAVDEKRSTSVHATTTNGAVSLEYVEHPVGQALWSYAASTNGKVAVVHPPGFEGDFEAETTWGSASVEGPEETEDPSGLGRERKKEIRTDRKELGYRHITGTVWWSEKGKDRDRRERGETMIKTTLGSARIEFL